MKLKIQLAVVFLAGIFSATAQDDLLKEIDDNSSEGNYEQPAFKAMKIGNLQSTKVASKGDLFLYVSHRFGSLQNGVDTFFGFDEANTKIQLVYGLFDNFQISASRESLNKTYASSAKYKFIAQSDTFPVNLVGYSTINIDTNLDKDRFPELEFSDRLSFANQLLVSRRINNNFSLELAPGYVRQNRVFDDSQDFNQFVLGIGGRMKVSKRLSINADYAYNFNRATGSEFQDPFTLGLDIETGGHVFQLLFSNAQSTNEPGFLSNAEGDWDFDLKDLDIFFGFNIVRVF